MNRVFETEKKNYFENEKDSESIINVLNIIYDDIRAINNDLFYCTKNDDAYIINKYGAELISGNKDTLEYCGNFIKLLNKENCTVSLYNVISGERRTLYDSYFAFRYEIQLLDNDLITVNTSHGTLILDRMLNTISGLPSGAEIYHTQNNISNVLIYYRKERYDYTTHKAILNKSKNKFDILDEFSMNGKLGCVATEYHKSKGIAINTYAYEEYKYKLSSNGCIVSKYAYEDIVKASSLDGTNYLYTYDLNDNGERCMGVLLDNGTEVLRPIYSEITYIGNNNFVLTRIENKKENKLYSLFNSEIGTIYSESDLREIYVHSSLPLSVITFKDNSTKLVDSRGNIFSAEDFSKYFKCSYNKNDPSIIRVEIADGLNKFVTNRLVPITNTHAISRLNLSEWINMSLN